MRPLVSRRALTLGALGTAAPVLVGCGGLREMPLFGALFEHPPRDGGGPVRAPDYARVYAAVSGERHPVPAFDYTVMDPLFLRADVAYRGPEAPGTIVVEPGRHLVYLVGLEGRALRYGIGVGPEARGRSGAATVGARRTWPSRDAAAPDTTASTRPAAWAQLPVRVEAAGTRATPLGARVLDLALAGQEIGYRIHGTPEPETIGTDVGTGAVRMIDQDVIDLFARTPLGTPVVVLA